MDFFQVLETLFVMVDKGFGVNMPLLQGIDDQRYNYVFEPIVAAVV